MSKLHTVLILVILSGIISCSNSSQSAKKEPWSTLQLIEPGELAKTINNPTEKQPVLFCIGPSGLIKNAIDIGPTKDEVNVAKLKTALSKLSKDTAIVIYCGCCPFKDCPNVRPAFKLLNDMKFTNHQLLNLTQNLKVDWINKGYPMMK